MLKQQNVNDLLSQSIKVINCFSCFFCIMLIKSLVTFSPTPIKAYDKINTSNFSIYWNALPVLSLVSVFIFIHASLYSLFLIPHVPTLVTSVFVEVCP